mmetsp:Transcript_21752/g.56471  ORF Transcript_21752/g.56471 Transcript_21752/m.56471 type:complete len:328 (-) Transcript_21752:100-1083(-)
MKAVYIEKNGGPEVLIYKEDYAEPKQRKRGHLLIEIAYTSVNPVDFKTRKGMLPRIAYSLPKVLGGDLAGVVLEADETSAFKKGERVVSHVSVTSKYGTYQERIVLPEKLVAKAPSNLSLKEAAGFPLVGLTAYQGLVEKAKMAAGQRVLIHAGSGGVGSFAVQLAKAFGCYVYATCGPSNVEMVKGLGADEVINYREKQFDEVIEPDSLDIVLDMLGGDIEVRSRRLVKPRGHLISILNDNVKIARIFGNYIKSGFGGKKFAIVMVHPDRAQLEHICRLYEEGKLKPVIDREFELKDIKEAHTYIEQGHAKGKIIVKVAGEEDQNK